MRKITSVKLQIQVLSNEPDALLDMMQRIEALKNAATHLVREKLHKAAPVHIGAMIELFNSADVEVHISSIDLEPTPCPQNN